MPVMDGGECCAKIRSLKTGTNVPIIGVTAHDDKVFDFVFFLFFFGGEGVVPFFHSLFFSPQNLQ